MGIRPTRRGRATRRAALAAALADPANMRVAKAQARGGFDPQEFEAWTELRKASEQSDPVLRKSEAG
jgi:hypothetical protein